MTIFLLMNFYYLLQEIEKLLNDKLHLELMSNIF